MQIHIQGKNMELTEEIKEYAVKRITGLEKLLSSLESNGGSAVADLEILRTTNHHKAGEVFRASCKINVSGVTFYGESDNEDLRAAIDEVKANLSSEIGKRKGRRQALFKRGGASIKKMLKGLSKRNPFTSKY